MSQISFSPDWLTHFTDPYAVLGLSLTSDDSRVLKRYRAVAKLLHPDSLAQLTAGDRNFAMQLLSRLVNPAYHQLKREKNRSEIVATLRLRVRRMNGDQPVSPQTEVGQRLIRTPVPQIDVFYEQTVTRLAELQFLPFSNFESVTQQLMELNLVYMYLKIGQPFLREKPTGIVAAKLTDTAPKPEEPAPSVSYAQRHYQRAQQYGKKGNWAQAIAELRDAIRLEPNQGEFHSLLAKAYLMQDLIGMAKVHFRQALKLNPNDPLASHYAAKLKISVDASSTQSNSAKKPSSGAASGGLFNLFARKR